MSVENVTSKQHSPAVRSTPQPVVISRFFLFLSFVFIVVVNEISKEGSYQRTYISSLDPLRDRMSVSLAASKLSSSKWNALSLRRASVAKIGVLGSRLTSAN